MMGRMDVEGYMIEASWDGQTLRVHAKNKMASVALVGQNRGEDLVLTADHIASVGWKGASAMTNGKVTLVTVGGASHQLHFRKKQQGGMRELYDALNT